MDSIHGLLIAEDDLNDMEDDEEEKATAAVMTQTPISAASHEAGQSAGPSDSIPLCKCGVCQRMLQEIENKCCGQRKCVTTHTRFHKLCLDPDVLQLAIRDRGDIRNDREDNSTQSFQKASYSA